MQGMLVGFAIDCDGADAEALGGAHDADCDFAAVGHEDLGKERGVGAVGAGGAMAGGR